MNPKIMRGLGHCLAVSLYLGYLVSCENSSCGQSTTAEFVSRTADSGIASRERPMIKIRSEGRELLSNEATFRRNRDWPGWDHAIRQLVALNDELRIHSRNMDGAPLAIMKKIIAGRLERAKLMLRQAERDVPSRISGGSASERLFVDPLKVPALAQQIQLPAQQAVGLGGGGAPFGGGGQGGLAAGQTPDNGEDLVALIERTINADVWQTVGGPASITYYQPALAIVISAPEDTHEGVANLLFQLRRAAGP